MTVRELIAHLSTLPDLEVDVIFRSCSDWHRLEWDDSRLSEPWWKQGNQPILARLVDHGTGSYIEAMPFPEKHYPTDKIKTFLALPGN